MAKYYIANLSDTGGISRYANHFFHHVLAPLDYRLIDSRTDPADILSQISSEDTVHVETGIFSVREQEILIRMLDSGYKKIRATLHDPPLFQYPSTNASSSWALFLAKARDRFLGGQKKFTSTLQKLECVYVLSEKGHDAVYKTFKLHNTRVIPHIVPEPVPPAAIVHNPDFVYIGFIGKNKGIEYALAVHSEFIRKHPESTFRIAGTTLDNNQGYMEKLRQLSNANVRFLGYVPETQLNSICSESAFAFQPFRTYSGYTPVSGSILYCMQQGTLVLSTPVNAIPELIRHEYNGLFLTGSPQKDAQMIHDTWINKSRFTEIRRNAYEHLCKDYSPEAIRENLKD